MIECGVHYNNRSGFTRAMQLICNSESYYRPIYFSDEEKVNSRSGLISDNTAFEKFKAQNQGGFFLLSDIVLYDLSNVNNSKFEISIFQLKSGIEHVFPEMFVKLSTTLPQFAFACESEEYYHRNRLYFRFGKKEVEAWVGRSIEKYIPGIYWLTLLSKNYSKTHGLNLRSLIKKIQPEILLENKDQLVLKIYPNSFAWKDHSPRINIVLEGSRSFFLKSVVENATRNVESTIELVKALKDWK